MAIPLCIGVAMDIISWDEYLAGRALDHLNIAIGVFDGLHVGHAQIIDALKAPLDNGVLYKLGVITFMKNPKTALKKNTYGALMSYRQQMEGFEKLGVDQVILVDFSSEFSRLNGHTFMSLVTDATSVGRVVIGEDFCCGHNRDLDAEGCRLFLSARGTSTMVLPPVLWQGEPVSSTRIRKAVAEGCFQKAESMLGKPFSLDLTNTPIQHIDKGVSILRDEITQVLPTVGTYTGLLVVANETQTVNISVAPREVRIVNGKTTSPDALIFLGKE